MQRFYSGSRNGKYCTGSTLYSGYDFRWILLYMEVLSAGFWQAVCIALSKKTDFWKYFDLVMPSVALAQGFGRIGCLLAGCCYGRETNSIFSITFQNSDFAPNHVALIPTQIYSSVLDFLHFGILLYIARHKKKDGQVAACYLIFYSIGRFVLEFFRGDLIRGSVGMLSTSQFISLFILVAGILILVIRSKKKTATDL